MAELDLQWTGGVNLLEDDQVIRDDQLAMCKNAFPTTEGLLDKREPVRGVANFLNTGLGGEYLKPVTLMQPDPILGLDFIIHGLDWASGDEYLTALSTDSLTTPLGGIFKSATGGLSGPVSFVNFRGRFLAVTAGQEGFAQLNRRPDGSIYWSRVPMKWIVGGGIIKAQSQSQAITPRVIGTYKNRLVLANFGPGMGNWLVFGDREVQAGWTNTDTAPPWAIVGNDVLSANGFHAELVGIQGEDILAVKEISLSAVGSPIQSALLVLTDRSAIICMGETAQTTDTDFSAPNGYIGTFEADKVNYTVGVAGPNCMCETPYGLCWASNDEVWMMNGNTPVRVGSLIRPALRATPPALRKFWSMAYANGFVFLAICTNNSVSEREQRTQHWRLDLRRGPPEDPSKAKWWGPQDYEKLPDVCGNTFDTMAFATSIVSKKNIGDSDIVYGAAQVSGQLNLGVSQTVIVSLNQGNGGDDMPYKVVTTGRVWSAADAGLPIVKGDIVRPTILKANGRLYVCLAAGLQGGIEPVWPDVTAGTVLDGSVVWGEIQNILIWNRLPSYYSGTYTSAIIMDVLFKDYNFGQTNRDKVIRRGDVMAYFSTRALVSLRILCDEGVNTRILGPTTIGGIQDSANDLGLAILDVGAALAQDYQARSLRPGYTTGHLAADPLAYWQSDDSGLANSGGVIRGRTIQPRFMDDDGLVIDESNNYISWASINTTKPFNAILQVFTAKIATGRYANVDALLTEITNKMNVAQGAIISGFTLFGPANPWSFDSAYVNNYPYMNTFTFSFSTRDGGHAPALVFIFGDTISEYGDDTAVTLLGTNCYPIRTKRLLSQLGFDTRSNYTAATGIVSVFSDGNAVRMIGEQQDPFLVSPTRISAIESMPYTRSPFVSLSSVDVDYYIKPGLPFSKRSR